MPKKNEKCKEDNCSEKIEYGDEDGDYCSNHWLVKFPNQRNRVYIRRMNQRNREQIRLRNQRNRQYNRRRNQRNRVNNSFLSTRKEKARYRGVNCLCTPNGPHPDCNCLSKNYDLIGLNQYTNIQEMYPL
jgi:hypothetical protein